MYKNKETVYRCEYCNKPYFNSTSCRNHEKICFRNEDNKTCITCLHSNFNYNGGCTAIPLTDWTKEKVSDRLYKNCSLWESLGDYIENL